MSAPRKSSTGSRCVSWFGLFVLLFPLEIFVLSPDPAVGQLAEGGTVISVPRGASGNRVRSQAPGGLPAAAGTALPDPEEASVGSHAVYSLSGAGDRSSEAPIRGDFRVPAGLEGKVEFWKLIFTKYRQTDYVFHSRNNPEIIYSVLDLSAIAQGGNGGQTPRPGQLVEEETARIRSSLKYLAEGKKPRDPFERRVKRLFAKLESRGGPTVYQEAAEEDQIRYQQGIRDKMMDAIARSGRYLHAMERVFRDRGLPVELTRIPFIESSFDYTAYSSVGAAGIWQFMRGTGKKYMRINASVDERRDPIAATYAAAEYLRSAYDRLQSWPLAVTSYNHGVTGMARGADAAGSKNIVDVIDRYTGNSFGFASKNFYAEFLAALAVEREKDRYFPGLQKESPWYFEEVLPGRSLSFAEVMRFSGASREDLERLNRSLLSPVLSGRARIPADMVIRLPAGAGKRLQAQLRGSAVVGIIEPPKPKPEKAARHTKGKRATAPEKHAAKKSKKVSAKAPHSKGTQKTVQSKGKKRH